MCNYTQHYRDRTKVCATCKATQSDYAKRWRRDGPQQKDGLPELVTDYVATNEPVTIMELQTIVRLDKPNTNIESLRRATYRLIDRGILVNLDGMLNLDPMNGCGMLKCQVCDRPYSLHTIGHCPVLGDEPVLEDAVSDRTVARRKAKT